MPNAVTVEHPVTALRATRNYQGVLVPWEVNGYFEDDERARTHGGVFDLSHWGVISIEGKDSSDYLHRMTTCNVRGLTPDAVAHAAFLTGRANPVAMGWLERLSETAFLFHVPPPLVALTVEHIEKFHFAEAFETKDLSSEESLWGLWRPEPSLWSAIGLTPDAPVLRRQRADWDGIPVVSWKDDSRSGLAWVRIKRAQSVEFLERLTTYNVRLVGQRLFEYHRVLAAVPQVGLELSEKEIILEGNFDRAIARNKGCYPGQEVVERIFTYGQVNRKLFPVTLESAFGFPAVPVAVEHQGQIVGQVVACVETPENPLRAAGLMYLHKSVWDCREGFQCREFPELRICR